MQVKSFPTKITFWDSFSDLLYILYFLLNSHPYPPFSDTDCKGKVSFSIQTFISRLRENLSFSYILKPQLIGSLTGLSNNINTYHHFLKQFWILTLTPIASYHKQTKTLPRRQHSNSTTCRHKMTTLRAARPLEMESQGRKEGNDHEAFW